MGCRECRCGAAAVPPLPPPAAAAAAVDHAACVLPLRILDHLTPSTHQPPGRWVTYDMFHAALRSDRCLNISELAPLPRTTEFSFNVSVCADASGAPAAGKIDSGPRYVCS